MFVMLVHSIVEHFDLIQGSHDFEINFVRRLLQHLQGNCKTIISVYVSFHIQEAVNCCLYFGKLLSTTCRTCCADAQLLHVEMPKLQLKVLKDFRRFKTIFCLYCFGIIHVYSMAWRLRI